MSDLSNLSTEQLLAMRNGAQNPLADKTNEELLAMSQQVGNAPPPAEGQKKPFTIYDTWPAQLIKSIYSGLTLPGDVYAGKDSPNNTKRVLDLAMIASPSAPQVGPMQMGLPKVGANARADKIVDEMITPQTPARLRELGPDAFLFEGNPTLGQTAQGVVQRPGTASESLRTAVTERHEGTSARLNQDIRDNFGPPVAPSRVDARIGRAQDNLGPDYRAALADTGPANVRPILQALDSDIAPAAGAPRRALQEIRGHFFDNNRPKSSVGEMLSIRQAIDDMVPRYEGQENALRLIGTYRQAVDDAIREAAPSVKSVDARFENLARQRDALGQGQTVLRTGAEATRPSELARILASQTPTQNAALRMGTRADIERTLGTSVFDVNALRNAVKSEGKWNHEKLSMIFGQREADNVMSALDREVAFRRAYDRLISNSQTAPRLVAEEATRVNGPGNITPEMVAGATAGVLTGNPVAALGTAGAVSGARRFWESMAAGGQKRLDKALVDRLGAQGSDRDAIIDRLMATRGNRGQRNVTREMMVRALMLGTAVTGAQ